MQMYMIVPHGLDGVVLSVLMSKFSKTYVDSSIRIYRVTKDEIYGASRVVGSAVDEDEKCFVVAPQNAIMKKNEDAEYLYFWDCDDERIYWPSALSWANKRGYKLSGFLSSLIGRLIISDEKDRDLQLLELFLAAYGESETWDLLMDYDTAKGGSNFNFSDLYEFYLEDKEDEMELVSFVFKGRRYDLPVDTDGKKGADIAAQMFADIISGKHGYNEGDVVEVVTEGNRYEMYADWATANLTPLQCVLFGNAKHGSYDGVNNKGVYAGKVGRIVKAAPHGFDEGTTLYAVLFGDESYPRGEIGIFGAGSLKLSTEETLEKEGDDNEGWRKD